MTPSFTTPDRNRQIVLVRRPSGNPTIQDFALRTAARPVPDEGQYLVRNLYLSADPVQRGWAANAALTPLDAPMRALSVGVVIDSREPGIGPGEIVYGFFGWQDYAVATRADILSHIVRPRVPLPAYAGVLGMPGVTAWLALTDIAPPSEGKAILVTTAAGTVGSIVGQIARQAGAHVVGLTGSDDKVEQCVTRFGYHAAFNYRTADLPVVLAEARQGGFDIFFDNIGGPMADIALRAMARHGRIIQCGTAATPRWDPPPTGLRNEREILMRALSWTGFVIFDHVDRFGEAVEALTDLVLAGRLVHDEMVEPGIDRIAGVLAALFDGSSRGKTLIHIGED